MEKPVTSTFINVLQHQGTLDLSKILEYIRLDPMIEYAVGMRIGHEWYGQDSTSLIFPNLESIREQENLGVIWQNVDSNVPWSFIKGPHDSYYVFNPITKSIFIDDNVESWTEKSKVEGLRVVPVNNLLILLC